VRTIDNTIEAIGVEGASAGCVRQRGDADDLHRRNSITVAKTRAGTSFLSFNHLEC